MISAIILAAGASTRLGQPKQLLDIDGRPLLQHVVDAAANAAVDEIVVVLGHESDRIAEALRLPSTARVVVNPDYMRGQSTSLLLGLRSLDPLSDAAVLLLGDQPRLPATAIDAVIDAFLKGGSPIVRAIWDGTPGHPVVVARAEWAGFEALTGDTGARDVLRDSPRVAKVAMEGPPVDDVDTWEQYEKVRDRH
ncbi:MAG: molybdenum cofactor cytidylyltransferase [Actinomycetota bacterium]|nr:molybdenum cofactor cytidylyltransferase [Actinomycetota bacterium]